MNQNLDIIRAACIKANPEIAELKIGAKVKLLDYEKYPNAWGVYAGKQFWKSGEKDRDLVLHPDGKLYPMDKKHEIIGLPIRLADVLLAIEEKKKYSNNYDFIGNSSEAIVILNSWNLRKDDLAEQSEETITFIAGLLK